VDIVIALDTSKSMLARDIPPSRFERSRLEIKNLVNQLEGDRIGLVVFTSTALTQCPLTLDYATFGRFLDEVEVGTLDRGGTSLSAAIDQAVLAFDTRYKKDRILILVTDGETHDTRLKDSLRKAEKANIRIYTVGLGSREGVPILLPSGDGEKRYVKDAEGNIVLTRLSEEPLKKAAFATEGGYLQAGAGGFSLEKLYRNKIEPLLGREMEARRKKRYMHRFYVPLALALLCLVLHTFLPERRS
jgi:Ca-activated chloride channel family protein